MSNVIAIDGPAASGKSTIAKRLAERFRIAYVNTGSLYRAVALAAVRAGVKLDSLTPAFLSTLKLEYCRDDSGRYELKLNGEFPGAALRAPEIADGASLVATQPAVRNYLLDVQRSFAGARRIVMEGRDIGTVIFPDAEFKFFVTATPEERARRRLAQTGEVADGATLAEVARAIAERDRQDSTRAVAPLRPAPDAEVIDTTGLTIDENVDRIAAKIEERSRRRGNMYHEMQYRVPYADTDQMGVVYYANYLEYFERSRTEMLRSVGLPYSELEKQNIFLPVSEAHCRYLAPARYDDLLTFRSRVSEIKGVRMRVESEVWRGDELLVSGYVILVCVNSDRKVVRMSRTLIDACQSFLEVPESVK